MGTMAQGVKNTRQRSGYTASPEGFTMSTDKKNTKALAQAFFAQLQSGGYTPNQILDIATELIDQVTVNLKPKPAEVEAEPRAEA